MACVREGVERVSYFDDDLHPELVGAPFTYNFSALKRVFAAPITLGNELVGYLFLGSDEEPGSAGVLSKPRHVFRSKGAKYWRQRLEESFSMGLSAREAVSSLLGASGPGVAGTVGQALVERSGKSELEDELDPEGARRRAEAATRSRTRRAPTELPVLTLRGEMDAVLRGEISSSEQVRQRVAEFDEVLSRQPTPEAIIVTLTPAVARIPAGLERGSRVFEPSFTTSYLMGTKDRPEGVPVVVRLVVPAGIPAYFRPPISEGEPGVLMLGRGLEWEVQRVASFPEQTFIFAEVVSVRPEPIP